MAFIYVQGGSALYKVDTSGNATALTLPSGVTIDATRVGRFATLNRQTAFVNAPSINLVIDPEGTVRPLVLQPPVSQPIVAAGSGSGLTGAYRIKESFVVLDEAGDLYSESPLGPASSSVTLADNDLSVSGAAISPYADISLRREYRTAASGALYYEFYDLDGNTQVSYADATSDTALATLPAEPSLGAPPGTLPGTHLTKIVAWKDRFWATSDVEARADRVLYTESQLHYAWDPTFYFDIRPVGLDEFGVTAFIPRRDELLICKRYMIAKIVGSSPDDFELIVVVQGTGCVAPDSVVVIRDIGYFLGEDGVYKVDAGGVSSISRDTAHSWFATDTYFNRSRFPQAFARWNPKYDTYELHLANAGDSTENRWVSYDINRQVWLGPHKTGALTPTATGLIRDANDLYVPVMGGSDGKLYQLNQAAYTDGAATAIDFSVSSKFHSGNAPDIEKLWLDLSVISKVQNSGTLTITPTVGGLNASAGSAISHDLTTGRERLRRLGRGRFAQLTFRQNTNAVGATLYGYEVPFHELGRR